MSHLTVLLLVLATAGCGGFNANVPISPMMFMDNRAPALPGPSGGTEVAIHPVTSVHP